MCSPSHPLPAAQIERRIKNQNRCGFYLEVEKTITRNLWVGASAALALTLISSCGGGGGYGSAGGGSTPPANQPAGGIWTFYYIPTSGINAGQTVSGFTLVAETGQYLTFVDNIETDCLNLTFGTLSTSGNNVSGTADWVIGAYDGLGEDSVPPANCTQSGDPTFGSGTIAGAVSQNVSLSLTETDTVLAGAPSAEYSTTANFSSVYSEGSSLESIAGTYGDPASPLTISLDGGIDEHDPDGCNITGQISIINPSYNLYSVQIVFTDCVNNPVLNGVNFSGLVYILTTNTPISLLGALYGTANGNSYALGFQISPQS
jgi:hypothetical protein